MSEENKSEIIISKEEMQNLLRVVDFLQSENDELRLAIGNEASMNLFKNCNTTHHLTGVEEAISSQPFISVDGTQYVIENGGALKSLDGNGTPALPVAN